MPEPSLHRGGCLCGAIRFAARGEPTVVCLCHCVLCRRSVGATPVAWATFARPELVLEEGTPRWYPSTPTARRAHCEVCGTSLFFEADRWPDEIDVTVVAFDEAAHFGPTCQIWTPDRLPWAPLDDALPCHVGGSSSERIGS